MACPFFFPTDRNDETAFPHPGRLPLGAAWKGDCQAPGEHFSPNVLELESCNLGYAKSCSRLPLDRKCDAVRFGVAQDSGQVISLEVVFEAGHLPAGKWRLEYDLSARQWLSEHAEARIQKLADCFLQSYLVRKNPEILL